MALTNLITPSNVPLLNAPEVSVITNQSSTATRNSSSWSWNFPHHHGSFMAVIYFSWGVDHGGTIQDPNNQLAVNGLNPHFWLWMARSGFNHNTSMVLFNPTQVRSMNGSASVTVNYDITTDRRRIMAFLIKNPTAAASHFRVEEDSSPFQTFSQLGGPIIVGASQHRSTPNLSIDVPNNRLLYDELVNDGLGRSNWRHIAGVITRTPESRSSTTPLMTFSGGDDIMISTYRFSNWGALFYSNWQL